MISGDEWYVLDSIRAINQCIGRIIRHKNDYGAIFLCDNRFKEPRNQKDISGWIRHRLRNSNPTETFDSMRQNMSQFFENAKQKVI